jgi:3'-5' exoribonuclease
MSPSHSTRSFVVTRIAINQLNENQSLEQAFQAVDKQLRVNRQGGKYVLLKLSDRTGTISAMVWNADERTFESFQRGDYIFCRGRTQVHNGNLQIIVTDIEPLSSDEVDAADFDRFDSEQAGRLTSRLGELLGGFSNVHLRQLGQVFLNDQEFIARLQVAPAAVSNHHAYPGGLLRHTIDLMELAQWVGPRYEQIDSELLIFGAFLHDLGKIEELTAGESTYTDRGQLIGHLVIGVQMLAQKIAQLEAGGAESFPPEIRLQLEHMILSHHGLLEYGSPKIPHTLEAIALHHLDNLDAKLAAAISIIESDSGGDENWTNYFPAMGRKFWKPKN